MISHCQDWLKARLKRVDVKMSYEDTKKIIEELSKKPYQPYDSLKERYIKISGTPVGLIKKLAKGESN